ncbi:hypothetical protein [Aquibium microcysteis]|uniref:hypothetical protein n=1 Tax=Aquibium microcysteis TaxID=675281 RepID=UPI00165CFCBC|nr:hypothetical protein [Aquibium microcysteis]
MDWHLAIERNRAALKRVLCAILAMAGPEIRGQFTFFLSRGTAREEESKLSPHVPAPAPAPTLPRRVHRAVLRLLRPAEAAVRRLIVVAARDLDPPAEPGDSGGGPEAAGPGTVPQRRPAATSPLPELHRLGIAAVVPPGVSVPARPASRPAAAVPALPLADPPRRPLAKRRRTVPPHAAPRVLCFDGTAPHRLPPKPSPDDPLDAARLCRRLAALAGALADLDAQARRFLRWQARRARRAARQGAVALSGALSAVPWRRISPLRGGRPPGRRLRGPQDEAQEALRETHWFAVRALAFDTS